MITNKRQKRKQVLKYTVYSIMLILYFIFWSSHLEMVWPWSRLLSILVCFPKDDVTLSSFSSKHDYDIVSVQSEGKVERSVPQGIFLHVFSLNIYRYIIYFLIEGELLYWILFLFFFFCQITWISTRYTYVRSLLNYICLFLFQTGWI